MATEKNLGASGVLYTDRRDFYISPQVVKELWTDVTPFTTIISNKETRQTNDPLFKMFEHRQPWIEQRCFVAGTTSETAADNAEDSVDIDNILNLPTPATSGEGLAWKGLVFEVWDSTNTTNRGTVICTDITDSNTIKVKNMTDTAFSFADNDIMYVIGNAHGEGTEAPDAWADELKVVWNSTQIFKTPLQITGTLLQASLRGESSELARLRLQKSQEHKIQKERAFLFGTRVGGTGLQESAYADGYNDTNNDETFADGGRTEVGGSNLVRSTYGMISALEKYGESTNTHDYQNVFSVSEASYTYGDFVDDMEKVFQYVPDSGYKRAFVGAGALGYWSKMAGTTGMAGNSGWTVGLSDMKRDSLGFNYRMLETPHGMLQLIPTPSLRGRYNKHMLVVDESNLFHAQYRSPMYQTNIKTDNAFDGVKDQYFSDEGIGITQVNSHSLIKITA